MEALVVNHHYVRDDERFHAIRPDQFIREIEALGQQYRFVTPRELLSEPDDPVCLLSFDDGLREHYADVFPILRDRGICGVFFVATQALLERQCSHIQIRHTLSDRLGMDVFASEIDRRARNTFCRVTPFRGHHGALRDDPIARGVKVLLDYMDAGERNELLADIARAHQIDLLDLWGQTYFGVEEAREMIQGGMAIGLHGHSHQLLTALDFNEKARELSTGARLLVDVTGEPTRLISYPSSGYDPMVIKICETLGFELGFTTNRVVNRSMDRPLELGRFDCRDDAIRSRWEQASSPARA